MVLKERTFQLQRNPNCLFQFQEDHKHIIMPDFEEGGKALQGGVHNIFVDCKQLHFIDCRELNIYYSQPGYLLPRIEKVHQAHEQFLMTYEKSLSLCCQHTTFRVQPCIFFEKCKCCNYILYYPLQSGMTEVVKSGELEIIFQRVQWLDTILIKKVQI